MTLAQSQIVGSLGLVKQPRIPVILPPRQGDACLGETPPTREGLLAMLERCASEAMRAYSITTRAGVSW